MLICQSLTQGGGVLNPDPISSELVTIRLRRGGEIVSIGKFARSLLGACGNGSYNRGIEVGWDVCEGSVDFVQKIRLNPAGSSIAVVRELPFSLCKLIFVVSIWWVECSGLDNTKRSNLSFCSYKILTFPSSSLNRDCWIAGAFL